VSTPIKQGALPPQKPDYTGTHGRAWRMDLAAILVKQMAQHGKAPPLELNVCGWVAHAPYSHPIWPSVAINCISLRDVPGWPPATIHLQGATHELFVGAINPEVDVRLDETPDILRPLNFAGQFICASDDDARERVEQAVRDICDGTLNPDSDNRSAWGDRFSRSNAKPGFDSPDVIALTPGGLIAVGTGAANVKALEAIAKTSATLSADESKPQ